MAKPIIGTLKPIDALLDSTIKFSWSGKRAYSNRLVVYNNTDLSVAFDDTVATYKFEHTIPANTLKNGNQYVIEVYVTDMYGETSAASNKVSLYTAETPTFQFADTPWLIDSSIYTANIRFHSNDWEELSQYKFYLYDVNKKLLHETDSIFLDETETVSYTYRSLINDSIYYIRATGVTVSGLELDTGMREINVKYENQATYSRVYAENLPDIGCIKVSSNLIIIQYNGDQEFNYQDGMIDLRGSSIFYDNGFMLDDDFTVVIRGKYLWHEGILFMMSNGQYDITLSSRFYPGGQLRYKLEVPNGMNTYVRYSDPMVFNDSDMITVAFRRIGGLYQIVAFIELGFSTEGDTWYGYDRPAYALMQNYDYWINTDDIPTVKVEKDSVTVFDDSEEPESVKLYDLWFGGKED